MYNPSRLIFSTYVLGEKLTDWKKKTLGHWERINTMAQHRFGEGPCAEEAALFVMDGLEDNNWQRVQAFTGRASFSTYITVLTSRLLEDFARKRFGRIRPPRWVATLGGIWEKLFTALCLERLSSAEAVEVVYQRQFAPNKNEIEEAASELLGRIPDCGKKTGTEVVYDEENPSEECCSKRLEYNKAEGNEKQQLFSELFELICNRPINRLSEKFEENLSQLKINLTPQEKLILKLCYQDGLTVSQAANLLGLTRFQAHGKKRRLLQRLRAEFERTGLAKEIQTLLEA